MRQTPITGWVVRVTLPTITEPEQKAWSYLWEDNAIDAFTCVEYEVYTVEEGERLMLQSAVCSATSNTTGIASNKTMKFQLVISDRFLGDRYFRRTDVLTFAPLQEIKAEKTLYIYFYNLSSDIVRITMNFVGMIVAG